MKAKKGVIALSVKFGHLRLNFSEVKIKLYVGMVLPLFYALNRLNACKHRKALYALIAVALTYSVSACADGNTLQIAVICPLSGKDRTGGQAMLDGVNLRVAEINERGGIDGRKLKVLAHDDRAAAGDIR